jgi:hypothetical protein
MGRMDGYKPLKAGRIHLRCPKCGRKMSNGPRADYDPLEAVLIETHCENCCGDDKDSTIDYFAADGSPLEYNGSRYERVS